MAMFQDLVERELTSSVEESRAGGESEERSGESLLTSR